MLREFELIERYFRRPQPSAQVWLGSGDDAALITPPLDHLLAVTTDAQVLGTHFNDQTPAEAVGWKSLAVNLSDLAAMGAAPAAFTCALTLPTVDESWIAGFAEGLYAAAAHYDIPLVGGNISRGALSITIQAMGWCKPRQILRRDAAQPGDLICVTGTVGDAALALRLGHSADAFLQQRLQRPDARLREGLILREAAGCAIDLSDGLYPDLSHVLRASGCGARLNLNALPQSPSFRAFCPPDQRVDLQLAGGEDYELCVTLPEASIPELRSRLAIPLTVVGKITSEMGFHLHDEQGRPVKWASSGFRHF